MSFNLGRLYAPKCIITINKYINCFKQFKPEVSLNPYILCYWVTPFKSYNEYIDLKIPYITNIVPDGCTDILFRINIQTKEFVSEIYGPTDKPYTGSFYFDKYLIFGITFNPGGLYPFSKVSLNQLRNNTNTLEEVIKCDWSKLGFEIAAAKSIFEMINISNRFFSLLLDRQTISDSLNNMLYSIYKSKGNIKIKELSQNEIISERQINRIFNAWIGINPKTFSRIVRFQNIIKYVENHTKADWVTIALDNGYYDEAHFFNEFKEFCGTTPGVYVYDI